MVWLATVEEAVRLAVAPVSALVAVEPEPTSLVVGPKPVWPGMMPELASVAVVVPDFA